jgi:hypothetical protein
MTDHVCQCLMCVPDPRLLGPRLSERHVAVRFEDHLRDVRAYLNDEEVDSAFESVCGEWVARYSRILFDGRLARHICLRCGKASDCYPCYEIIEGPVELRRLAHAEGASA